MVALMINVKSPGEPQGISALLTLLPTRKEIKGEETRDLHDHLIPHQRLPLQQHPYPQQLIRRQPGASTGKVSFKRSMSALPVASRSTI